MMKWEDFEREMLKLSAIIDFKPDYIVGIVRGGLVPARKLSGLLSVKQMFCLNVDKKDQDRVVNSDISYDLHNKRILLVEDMLETGDSLMVAKEWIEKRGAMVKTACLYTMPITKHTPDYYLAQVQSIVSFPWE